MKRLIILVFPLLLAGCAGERKFPEVKKLSEYKETDFVITPQSPLPKNKNAVYSATLLLAWDQVRTISENHLTIDKHQPELTLINSSQSYKNTLEKDEYTAAADFNIEQGRLNIFTEFSKSLPFAIKLKDHKKELKFKGESVSTFGANDAECLQSELYNTIRIWHYKDDTDFAVTLYPEDNDHLVILYMPDEKRDNLQEIFDSLKEKMERTREERSRGLNSWKYDFGMQGDELLIPKFSFNIETDYKQLEGNSFVLQQQPWFIERAKQRTAFILDEEGAEADSEAELSVVTEESPTEVVEDKPHPKKLHFNKPFLVMLKRVDSPNPYFAMWVENTELMQK